MQRIKRRIDDPYFRIKFSQENRIYLDSLYASLEIGNNFTDSLFDTQGNKDILKINFVINNYKSNPLSYVKISLIKFEDISYCNIGYTELNNIINELLDKYEEADIHLMAAYADDDESKVLGLGKVKEILLLTTKLYKNDEVYCYVEECLTIEQYEFYDMGR